MKYLQSVWNITTMTNVGITISKIFPTFCHTKINKQKTTFKERFTKLNLESPRESRKQFDNRFPLIYSC